MKIDISKDRIQEKVTKRLRYEIGHLEDKIEWLSHELNEINKNGIELDDTVLAQMLVISKFDVDKTEEAYSRYILGQIVTVQDLDPSSMNDQKGWCLYGDYIKETN